MPIAKAPSFSSLEEEAKTQINQMHHNVSPNDPTRHRGLAKEPRVALLGLEPNSERESAYLNQFPKDIPVLLSLDLSEPDGLSQYLQGEGGFTDVFIAGTGADAAAIYESMETLLARSAAVSSMVKRISKSDRRMPIMSLPPNLWKKCSLAYDQYF